MRALDLEESPKLDSRDMEMDPKLDSSKFFIESNKTTNKAGHYDRLC